MYILHIFQYYDEIYVILPKKEIFMHNKYNIKEINYIKGIAILLVVIGHAATPSFLERPYFYEFIVQLIYSFHMPLFFLVYFLIGLYFRKYCFNNKEINIRNITTFKKLHYTYYHWYAYFLIHI